MLDDQNGRECRHAATGGEAAAPFLDGMAKHRLGRERRLDTLLGASYRAAACAFVPHPRPMPRRSRSQRTYRHHGVTVGSVVRVAGAS
jgi:hypothetical protein